MTNRRGGIFRQPGIRQFLIRPPLSALGAFGLMFLTIAGEDLELALWAALGTAVVAFIVTAILFWPGWLTLERQLPRAKGGVLFLRSFDGEVAPTERSLTSTAIDMVLLLIRLGISLALGRVSAPVPRKSSAPLQAFLAPAAARHFGPLVVLNNRRLRPAPQTLVIQTTEEQWHDSVEALLPTVACVIVVAGITSALNWELKTIRASIPPWRVFILTDPFNPVRWRTIRAMFAAAALDLPESDPGSGSLLGFEADWTPKALVIPATTITHATVGSNASTESCHCSSVV